MLDCPAGFACQHRAVSNQTDRVLFFMVRRRTASWSMPNFETSSDRIGYDSIHHLESADELLVLLSADTVYLDLCCEADVLVSALRNAFT